MLKTHKIALDPNNLQATQLSQHCGYARVAYNTALADFKTGLDIGQWRSHTELCRRFNAIKTKISRGQRRILRMPQRMRSIPISTTP